MAMTLLVGVLQKDRYDYFFLEWLIFFSYVDCCFI